MVIRFSSLGDVILTTPLLRVIRKNFPGSTIDFCTRDQYSGLLANNPNIDSIISVPEDFSFRALNSLKKRLSKNKYSLIVDLHNSLRTFYLKMFMRWTRKVVTVRKYSFRKFLLVKFKMNLMRSLPPIPARYIAALKKINIHAGNESLTPDILTDENASQSAADIIKKLNIPLSSKIICIVASSKHFTKTYPPEYIAGLINLFGANDYSFLLTGNEADVINIGKIKSLTGSNVHSLCGSLSLPELAQIMKRCQLVISGDTGPMHIAEALDIPMTVIAGSSVREFGFFPVSPKATVVENSGLKCRPCSHIGRSSCPKGHFKCMTDLKPEHIFEKIRV